MNTTPFDTAMMQRAIALAVQSGEEGRSYGVVIGMTERWLPNSTDRVKHEHDVTRHAEVVAISAAQKALDTVSLDDCTIDLSAELCVDRKRPDPREPHRPRRLRGRRSPHMGGVSRWPVLTDRGISDTMPEVFAAPPDIVAGSMARRTEAALLKWNPVVAGAMKMRGVFVAGSARGGAAGAERKTTRELAWQFPRRNLFDRFGRT